MNKPIPFLLALAALVAPMGVSAADTSQELDPPGIGIVFDSADVDLDRFLWLKRPVIVFADSPADPTFVQQMQFINDRPDELALRDVVVITDTDPAAKSALRTKLRPRGFMLVLIGKDGQIKLRKPLPFSVRELSRSIDKMPIRQQEIRDRKTIVP
ncbi:DUF4174 domain-containing protein [Marivita sp. S2033]|uniref:DUF4174 domain-containing protein n=1 Tax=Marivita sp. S2033 TaxID=3373187 RepID=UPI003982214A